MKKFEVIIRVTDWEWNYSEWKMYVNWANTDAVKSWVEQWIPYTNIVEKEEYYEQVYNFYKRLLKK